MSLIEPVTKRKLNQLQKRLIPRMREILSQHLPGGKLVENEYWCKNHLGGEGSGLKLNIRTGHWSSGLGIKPKKGRYFVSFWAEVKAVHLFTAYWELYRLAEVTPPKTDLIKIGTMGVLRKYPLHSLAVGEYVVIPFLVRTDGRKSQEVIYNSISNEAKRWGSKFEVTPTLGGLHVLRIK